MSVFKQFNTQDVTITPFTVNKSFSFNGYEITGSGVGIEFYTGINPTTLLFNPTTVGTTGIINKENTTGVYYSIKQLYYSNYLNLKTGDLVATQSLVPGATSEGDRYIGDLRSPIFDNYLQTSLTQSRYFPTATGSEISTLSIPSRLYGNNIVPNTFKLTYTSSNFLYSVITDDGEGNLITGSNIIGQIFYFHGIATFTSGGFETISRDVNTNVLVGGGIYGSGIYGSGSTVYGGIPTYINLDKVTISYSSSFDILETQYKCTIRENEFNYSLNPSILSGSLDDVYYNFATGSYFNPYITTVGLYNNNQELLAIGKLSQPIPISSYTDTTIIVSIDR